VRPHVAAVTALMVLPDAALARRRAGSRQKERPALPRRWRRRGWRLGGWRGIARIIQLPDQRREAAVGPCGICCQTRAGHSHAAGQQHARKDPTQGAIGVHSQIVRPARAENMGHLTYLVPAYGADPTTLAVQTSRHQ
jgi:hypothetical protein